MWSKLAALAVVTLVSIISIIPYRIHAVQFDPNNPPAAPTVETMLANATMTPGALAAILVTVVVASAAAYWSIRRR